MKRRSEKEKGIRESSTGHADEGNVNKHAREICDES
jgi:hypothetical protein